MGCSRTDPQGSVASSLPHPAHSRTGVSPYPAQTNTWWALGSSAPLGAALCHDTGLARISQYTPHCEGANTDDTKLRVKSKEEFTQKCVYSILFTLLGMWLRLLPVLWLH